MICVEEQYFNLNKILLLAVGLWPYQRTNFVRFQLIFFLGILITAVLFQLSVFLTSNQSSYLIIRILSMASFFSTFVVKYVSFIFNMEAMKNLLAQLQHIYNNLKDEYENFIIEKYSYTAKWYTVILTTIGICSVFTLIVVQFWSNIYDVVLLKNVSQSRHLLITTEYFIDREEHFYFIALHIYAAVCIGSTTVLAVGTILIAYLQHTCGMFRISSYRIKRVMKINMLQNNTLENKNLIFQGIICAIDIHRQAMKLSELLVYKFETMLFCLIAIGVMSLSLNLFQISTSENNNINDYFFPILFVMVSILYMFVANYVGQDVMDHTKYLFVTAYSVPWYRAPLYIQRIMLFVLQRGTKNFTLTVGGLFIGSLECFATLVKASVSYFTVMHSIQ
ncbi:PREDICTED: uncharacterized protein LOC105557878 isoform X1 [Vollenhovia emeryi]|uniref:uncharacterized protein LOC105557878 isoform X1 n=1 Tax=Vollenhovia emeryi TaxID=411798 RepID=UPI0005F528EA|nr:PREDICTED: uncharacterized protein LOC105557878 isoform X1 [Vollenhovia emeryi]